MLKPTERIVTGVNFESNDILSFSHCARLWHTTRKRNDYFLCGEDIEEQKLVMAARRN